MKIYWQVRLIGVLPLLLSIVTTAAGCLEDSPTGISNSGSGSEPESVASLEISPESVATASVNDGFSIFTSDEGECGEADYIDYGPGAPGGGNNDDYIVIHNWCSSHGIKAWVWLTRGSVTFFDERYNGNGVSGPPVIWDPFKAHGNVQKGDKIGLKVCLSDGNSDPNPFECVSLNHVSVDG